MSIFQKLFISLAYSVGYRLLNSSDNLPSGSTVTSYNSIKANNNEWYADPFCFEHEERIYIFMEVKNVWRGPAYIGAVEIINGKAQKVTKALAEPFHISYPNLFKFKNSIYMLPETSAVSQLRLYKAISFPLKWELDAILLEGVKYADCSFLFNGHDIFLFCYNTENEINDLIIYNLDMNKKALTPVWFDKTKVVNHRPAGNLFKHGDAVYRPLQECTFSYGEKLHLCKMKQDPSQGYNEYLYDTILHSNIKLEDGIKYSRIHTLNRSRQMEVVDAGFDKFYLNKIIWRLYNELKNISSGILDG